MSLIIPKKAFSLIDVSQSKKFMSYALSSKMFPEPLAEVSAVLANAKINTIMGSMFHVDGRPGLCSWASFIDVSRDTRSIHKLEHEMRKLNVVIDVKVEHTKPASFETIHFPILHRNTRAVIIPIGTLWTLWDGLEKILSPSGLAAVHYGAGKNTGEYVAKHLKEEYGLGNVNLNLAFAQAMKATDWGAHRISRHQF